MIDSVPNTPQIIYSNSTNNSLVKVAEPQYIIVGDEEVSIETMSNLIFEDIGGQEIINIDRNDTVFGSNLVYDNIYNSNKILQSYNSYTLASVFQTSYEYFKNFTIILDQKIPNVGHGNNGTNVYIESSTGDLIVELINIEDDEQVEISILTNGSGYYDTI
jgi:hypothetical protein